MLSAFIPRFEHPGETLHCPHGTSRGRPNGTHPDPADGIHEGKIFSFDIYNLTKSSVSLLDSCSWQSGVQFRLVHWASEPEDQNFQPPFCNMRVVQSKGLTPYAIRAGTSKFVASNTRMTYLFSGS